MVHPSASDKPARLMSLDAYRGFVMLAMASDGFRLARVTKHEDVLAWFAGTSFDAGWRWLCQFLAYHTDHVRWTGCSFWDLIQPSFMFMVGVSMPYSYAARAKLGESGGRMFAHVIWRSIVLVLLGIFLSSNWGKQTNFTFVNVLTQIGLGYWFVYLLLGRHAVLQGAAVATILGGYWWAFYQHPLPSPDFDYSTVGVPQDWSFLQGIAAHWDKNTNFAAWFDADWHGGFMNLFPRPEPFRFNDGGYQTLNFVPSMATIIFGLMTGQLLRGSLSPGQKTLRMLLAGAACLACGMAVDSSIWPYWLNMPQWSVAPIVKRIWTPSWAVFSTGWTLWMLAGFYWVIDVVGWKKWSFPLVVVGMNSIAMYCMAQLLKPWIARTLEIHIPGCADLFKLQAGPTIQAAATLFVMWLMCLWMYRQKIFVRI